MWQTADPAARHDGAVITRELSKEFDEKAIVDRVSMTVPRQTIFGFIGPSGCGKTTTVRLILGILRASSGDVEVLGMSPDEFTTEARRRIGYMPQEFVMYPDLTVWENLNFSASLYGVPLRRADRLRELLDLVELTGHERKQVRNISKGMRQRLSLAAALTHQPALIFLDEPTAGIDPVLRSKFWQHFQHLKDEGRTIFVTTQYMSEAVYCDYVAVMNEGRLLMVATPDQLRHRALGGDVIIVKPDHLPDQWQLAELRRTDFVRNEQVDIRHDLSLQMVVNDANTALPATISWLEERGFAIEAATEHTPPFDDVFVQLLEQETAGLNEYQAADPEPAPQSR
ncbi:MAG TPA: ABC transporter ATP-binding protein [Promineifilum sp.]